MSNPVILIHGYSDQGTSFNKWREALQAQGYEVTNLYTSNYATLANEISISDIAEGFDRALRIQTRLKPDDNFDAIVHSTGMLVIRAWLANYASRRSRLKHLIGLAPGSFGSPLAHKGRSWLGALFKGNRDWRGPDFLEAGDQILDGLELGSRFTWDLAHRDLIGKDTYFGPEKDTPYVFTFCGTEGLKGIYKVVNEPGMDGTVRWAGCPLNTRKIVIDLTVPPGAPNAQNRFQWEDWCQLEIPFIPVAGINHETILRDPSPALIQMVVGALQISSKAEFDLWLQTTQAQTQAEKSRLPKWQQFVVRAVDDRGDPIPDYNLQVVTRPDQNNPQELNNFDLNVHTYGRDHSLRCFHVNLDDLHLSQLKNLYLRLIASSGSPLVGYYGYGSEKVDSQRLALIQDGKWDAEVDISGLLTHSEVKFFHPFTTTLVEIKLNREPLPLVGRNKVFWFSDP